MADPQQIYFFVEVLVLFWLTGRFLQPTRPDHPDYGSGGSKRDFARRGSRMLFQDKNRQMRVTVYKAGSKRKYFVEYGSYQHPSWLFETREQKRIIKEWVQAGNDLRSWCSVYSALYSHHAFGFDSGFGHFQRHEMNEPFAQDYLRGLRVPESMWSLVLNMKIPRPSGLISSLPEALAAGLVCREDYDPETFEWLMGMDTRIRKLIFLRGIPDYSLLKGPGSAVPVPK